jgi:uncharacterized membrane protein
MPRTERIWLAMVVGCFGVAYALYGLFRHWHFGSSAYDLGIFDQAVWHLSRFEAPASSIRGFTNLLGDHFSPILAMFAPLYWIVPRPEMLIIAQAALFAVSIVPVFLFSRDRLPRGPAIALAIAYGLFWGLQRAAAFDVHEVAFAPLAIAIAILAMDRKRWVMFWMAAGVLILTKEDLIPLLGAFGVWLFFHAERRQAVLLVVISIVAFVTLMAFVIPAFNEAGAYGYAGAYQGVLDKPWLMPLTLVTPVTKLRTVLLWFAPFAFAPLASPLSLLMAPLAMERLLSASPYHWGPAFHYSAPLAPIIAMSAADGLSRMASRLRHKRGDRAARRFIGAMAAVSVLLSAFLPGRQPLWRVFAASHYRGSTVSAVGNTVVRMVPDGASVVAQAAVVPHLSRRHAIYVLDDVAPDAEYVIAADALNPWPLASTDDLRTLVAKRRSRGYAVIFEQNGWTVLRRASP